MKIKIGGWKTKTSAAALIFTGLATIATGLVQILDGNFDTGIGIIQEGFISLSTGGGILGIGHKVEKNKAVN